MRSHLILLFLILCPGFFLQAQLDSSDFSYDVQIIADGNSIDGMDTLYYHQILLSLNDTVNISKILVKIGSSNGLDDVASYAFVYDIDTFLPAGYSYSREGGEVSLVVGKYPVGLYFYELKLLGTDNMETGVKKWNTWNQ